MTSGLSDAEFGAMFQRFADSPTSTAVYRLERHQRYAIPTDEPSLIAFREGTSRPERSVRTSPWLARIATSTVAGKAWRRVRVITEPVSEYVRWELLAYIESQAAGEEIRILALGSSFEGPEDVWVFDGDELDDRYAIAMHYDAEGRPVEYEHVREPGLALSHLAVVSGLFTDAVTLNEYLASRPEVLGAA